MELKYRGCGEKDRGRQRGILAGIAVTAGLWDGVAMVGPTTGVALTSLYDGRVRVAVCPEPANMPEMAGRSFGELGWLRGKHRTGQCVCARAGLYSPCEWRLELAYFAGGTPYLSVGRPLVEAVTRGENGSGSSVLGGSDC